MSQRAKGNQVIVGAQWGDEGKGKIVDHLAENADVVVRFGGGNNAGHTLVVNGKKLVLHLIPSGILHPGTVGVLGDGMVVDPTSLLAEMDGLTQSGVAVAPERLVLSSRAHLILPIHQILDGLREGSAGALGTTRRGVGPAYEDRASRRGVRVQDLFRPERLRERVEAVVEAANCRIVALGGSTVQAAPIVDGLLACATRLRPFVRDTWRFFHEAREQRKQILFEGAQGVLLDVDHGTYPYVTSSSTVAGGASHGAGVGPKLLGEVVGVAKAYVTRVGDGPFPTELSGEVADLLRARGNEYGATTGRPRRCGWLDLCALRYAVEVSGIDILALTKLDVLSSVRPLYVCDTYDVAGAVVDVFPDDPADLALARPVLRQVLDFDGELSNVKTFGALPQGARELIGLIEASTATPVRWISVGPSREQTIIK